MNNTRGDYSVFYILSLPYRVFVLPDNCFIHTVNPPGEGLITFEVVIWIVMITPYLNFN